MVFPMQNRIGNSAKQRKCKIRVPAKILEYYEIQTVQTNGHTNVGY